MDVSEDTTDEAMEGGVSRNNAPVLENREKAGVCGTEPRHESVSKTLSVATDSILPLDQASPDMIACALRVMLSLALPLSWSLRDFADREVRWGGPGIGPVKAPSDRDGEPTGHHSSMPTAAQEHQELSFISKHFLSSVRSHNLWQKQRKLKPSLCKTFAEYTKRGKKVDRLTGLTESLSND
eukprot:1150781-Pelagomonas_calceolata.AAC.7